MLCSNDLIDRVDNYRAFLLKIQAAKALPSFARESLDILDARRYIGLRDLALILRLRDLRFQALDLIIQGRNAFSKLLNGKHTGPVCRVIAARLLLQLIDLPFDCCNVVNGTE